MCGLARLIKRIFLKIVLMCRKPNQVRWQHGAVAWGVTRGLSQNDKTPSCKLCGLPKGANVALWRLAGIGLIVKYILALSVFVATPVVTSAQYIMQPSLGGTYDYGSELKSENSQPTNRKTKTAHRRAVRNQQHQSTRQPVSRLPGQ
jgi:hypothetical protein